jgi:hypothetical protein
MARQQASLFDDVPAADSSRSGEIVIRTPAGRKLTPAEQTFNKRVARVEKLREKADRETRRLDRALEYHAEHLKPRLERQTALRKDLARAMARFLEDKRLKRKGDREALRSLVAAGIDTIAGEEGRLVDEDLRTLFGRVHGVAIEDAENEGIEFVRSMMGDVLDDMGIDLDLSRMRPGMSEEEIAATIAGIEDEFQRKVEALEEEEAENGEEPSNARERARTERIRQTETLRKKNVGSVYKRLARALHPDLEPDEERRRKKSALMQQLTAAYRGNDLHTLLAMELEWIEGEESVSGRLTPEQLKVYNEVLGEQARELEQEIADLPLQPRYQPLVEHRPPFAFRVRASGPAEIFRLDRLIEGMERSLEDLRGKNALRAIRERIREYRTVNELRGTPF